jgi:hypothetical protein
VQLSRQEFDQSYLMASHESTLQKALGDSEYLNRATLALTQAGLDESLAKSLNADQARWLKVEMDHQTQSAILLGDEQLNNRIEQAIAEGFVTRENMERASALERINTAALVGLQSDAKMNEISWLSDANIKEINLKGGIEETLTTRRAEADKWLQDEKFKNDEALAVLDEDTRSRLLSQEWTARRDSLVEELAMKNEIEVVGKIGQLIQQHLIQYSNILSAPKLSKEAKENGIQELNSFLMAGMETLASSTTLDLYMEPVPEAPAPAPEESTSPDPYATTAAPGTTNWPSTLSFLNP